MRSSLVPATGDDELLKVANYRFCATRKWQFTCLPRLEALLAVSTRPLYDMVCIQTAEAGENSRYDQLQCTYRRI